jgi:hypothetical protein
MSDDASPTALDWAGTVLLAGSGALAGLLETLLVPLYVGAVIVPVTIVLAIATNIGLPLLVRALIPRTAIAAAPFLTWLVVVVIFGVVTRPEGDVVLPGSPSSVEWVVYGVILGGAAAGVATLVAISPPPPQKGRSVSR